MVTIFFLVIRALLQVLSVYYQTCLFMLVVNKLRTQIKGNNNAKLPAEANSSMLTLARSRKCSGAIFASEKSRLTISCQNHI